MARGGIVGGACRKGFHVFGLLAQRVLVDGEDFLVGQRLHVGFGDERVGHGLVAICFALRGLAQVAG